MKYFNTGCKDRENLTGVILAAGKSSRYQKLRHKFLDKFQGKEIIKIVLEAMLPLVKELICVVSPDHEEIKRILREYPSIKYAIQEKPLGTGDALLATAPLLEGSGKDILVSFADKPLVTSRTFSLLISHHFQSRAHITFATTILPDPGSKGRIIRKEGKFVDIIEARDADEETKKIKEVHAGYLCCNSKEIFKELRKLDNNNKAGEYYLTKVYSLYLKDGYKVETVTIPPEESYDVNTVRHLEDIQNWVRQVKEAQRRNGNLYHQI